MFANLGDLCRFFTIMCTTTSSSDGGVTTTTSSCYCQLFALKNCFSKPEPHKDPPTTNPPFENKTKVRP